MRVTTVQEQTCPKLPMREHHIADQPRGWSASQQKMKFSWKANWEILLVLVIIIVGIVITTIAAIRSKDKHLLVLPDDTSDYGGPVDQAISSQHQVPPLPPTDFQLHGVRAPPKAPDEQAELRGGNIGGTRGHSAASSPFAATTIGPASATSWRPAKLTQSQSNSHLGNHNHHQQIGARAAGGQRRVPVAQANTISSESSSGVVATNHRHKPESGEFSLNSDAQSPLPVGKHPPDHITVAGGGGGSGSFQLATQDNYDALSTEATPSQMVRVKDKINQTNDTTTRHGTVRGPGNGRRNVLQQQQQQQQRPKATEKNLEMSDGSGNDRLQAEHLDDFHTTRSALAPANQLSESEQIAGVDGANSDDQAAQPPSLTPPPLSMHGPYELSHSVAHQQQNQVELHDTHQQPFQEGAIMMQHANKSDDLQLTQPPPQQPVFEAEDMMTSYSRVPQTNLTDAILRDYNMAAAAAATAAQATSLNETRKSPELAKDLNGQLARQRSSLPFAMLLGDIIRLTQPNSASLINTQANLEQPANSRPQYSILQQLRSLPGPLLALLQGGSSYGSNQQHDTAKNLNHLQPTNAHDSSESSEHYQRISMAPSDMSMILSRSLRASSNGALPAFPPPKGVPQNWIPPTAGGTPINDAVNINADFIASNTAGFLRVGASASGAPSRAANGSGAQQAQQANGSQQQQLSSNNQNAYQQQQQTPPADSQQQQQQQQQQQPQAQNYNQRQANEIALNQALIDEAQRKDQQQQHGINNMLTNVQQTQPTQRLDNGAYRQLRHEQQSFVPNQQQQLQQAYQNNLMQTNLGSQPQALGALNNGNGNNMLQAHQFNQQQQQQQQQAQMLPTIPMYNPRQTNSELFESTQANVPSGYNAIQQQQQLLQMLQAPGRPANLDLSAMPVESAPRPIVAAKNGSPMQRPTDQPRAVPQGPQPIQLNAVGRRKRSIARGHDSLENGDSDEEEEYLDSRPMSIVSPDGRPMAEGERVKILRHQHQRQSPQATESKYSLLPGRQRTVNQHDLDESALHHYASQRDDGPNSMKAGESHAPGRHKQRDRKRPMSNKHLELEKSPDEQGASRRGGKKATALNRKSKNKKKLMTANKGDKDLEQHQATGAPNRSGDGKRKAKDKNIGQLETASSGLMSKLLGTASTNDELEEDLDGDDDENSANERRKEEQEDAEFGIVNDERSNAPSSENSGANSLGLGGESMPISPPNEEVSRLSAQDALGNLGGSANNVDGSTINSDQDSSLGSGSAGTNSYTGRSQQQQRSDVEFYGHPGEETRQLKYGILGSGNYEVVNGGIYPDIDESTAAVNSVANYVRKPGNVLLAGLPKLLAAAGSSGGPDRNPEVEQQAAFMPGGRMSGVGGFMRGASAHPGELVGMFPPLPPSASGEGKLGHLTNPLLELIDANSGHLFHPNLMAQQLGSSGTSARTTFSSREPDDDVGGQTKRPGDNELDERRTSKARNKMTNSKEAASNQGKRVRGKGEDNYEIEHSELEHASSALARGNRPREQEGDSSTTRNPATGSRGQGTNQFYSYQILPSKKVTIFSDQDLDSAPSERVQSWPTKLMERAY